MDHDAARFCAPQRRAVHAAPRHHPLKTMFLLNSRCLKISEKGSFNILGGQKFIKNAQNWQVTFNWTKMGGNAKLKKMKCGILSSFQTM